MFKIGLTGGIGSGKSTVAAMFLEQGVPVVDADQIAKEIVDSDLEVLSKIVNYFGLEILDNNKKLNRAALKKIIFENPEKRIWLEKLLHPLIMKEIENQTKKLTAPYCILVIPLLIEATSPHNFVDRILVVDVSENVQMERTAQRDCLDKSNIEKILKSQTTREKRLKIADDVIENNGGLENLAKRVRALHSQYLKLK